MPTRAILKTALAVVWLISISGRPHISRLQRIIHRDWNAEYRIRVMQLYRRLLYPVLASVIAVAVFVLAINPSVRQNLNRTATQTLSGRFQQIVGGYFSPLFQFFSTSSLWTDIGQIDNLGNPESYMDSLYQNLRNLDSVSTLSLADSGGRELVLRMLPDGGFDWFETTTESADSLVAERPRRELAYHNLGVSQEESTQSLFRISSPYILPHSDIPGITLKASLETADPEKSLSLWIDLPLSRLADWLEPVERFPDAVVFLLLPGNEFLMFSVGELLAYADGGTPGRLSEVYEVRQLDSETLVEVLSNSLSEEPGGGTESVFTYNDLQWRAEFRTLTMGSQDIRIGTFIPVESLWLADVALPIQLVGAAVFILMILLTGLVIYDFRTNGEVLSEEELFRMFVRAGESSSLEFKSSLRWDYRQDAPNKDLEAVIMKSIAAFSNSSGGNLLIGVDDEGKALGLEPDYSCLKAPDKDHFELHLRSLLISRYGTDLATNGITISFPVLNGKEICQVEVKKGRKPLYTSLPAKGGGGSEKFYVRSGNSSRAIETLGEITSYVVSRFGRRAVE